MSHFGDPEAHRRVLHEISSLADSTKSFAYLQAAVMGSMGSAKVVASLHETPGLMEMPSKLMRAQLALLTATVCAAKGSSRYAQEGRSAAETVAEAARQLARMREQQQKMKQEAPLNLQQGASFTLLPTSTKVGVPFSPKDPAMAEKEGSEVTEDFLYMAMSYLNFLGGFTSLWVELFGANYFIWNHRTGAVEEVPQVPPHLYAVDWQSVLTPERQAWCRGLHEKAKELLRQIVMREMPLEVYFLYILFAALSLRLRLLETAAEVFTWSSLFVDIPYCVRQLYTSYRDQCEFARLQDVWRSFGLLGDSFIEDCGQFNLECSAAQGAFFETAQDPPVAPAELTTSSPGRHLDANQTRDRSGVSDTGGTSPYVREAGGSGEASVGEGLLPPSRAQRRDAGGGEDAVPAALDGRNPSCSSSDFSASDDEDNEGDNVPRRVSQAKEKEVYVPMFHTECRFTWLLQRLFWSLYGRCTLLFGSCIKLDLAPSLSVDFMQHNEAVTSRLAAAHRGEGSRGRRITDPAGAARPHHTGGVPLETQARLPLSPPSNPPQNGATPLRPAPPSSPSSSRPAPRSPSAWTSWTWRSVKESIARAQGVPRATRSPTPLSSHSAAQPAAAPATLVSAAPSARDEPATVLPPEPQAPFFLRYTWHRQGGRRPAGETDGGEGGGAEEPAATELATPAEMAAEYLTEFSFLTMGGCYVLAHAVHVMLTTANYPATLLMLSDNSTRPGLRNWVNHRYVISAVADDPAERDGADAWVLNFVLPRFRLSHDAASREDQEEALIHAVLPHLRSRHGERVAFTEQDSLFYVLNCGPYMDQGRSYFVLHLHIANVGQPASVLLDREATNAFGSLEEVRLAWYMTCSSNEALRLAAAIDVPDRG